MESESQMQLRRSFRRVFGGSEACVALLDASGAALDASRSASEYFSFDGPPTEVQKKVTSACAGFAPGTRRRLSINTKSADGSMRVLEAELTSPDDARDGEPTIIVWLKDITDHVAVEREATLLATLALALGRTDSPELGITVTLEQICLANGWALGEAWFPRDERDGGGYLYRKAIWTAAGDSRLATFARQGGDFRFRRGEGLPGKVWATGKLVRSPKLRDSSDFTRGPLAAAAGLRSAVAVPMIASDEVVAVLEFFTRSADDVSDRALALVQSVATPLALLIQQKGAEEAHRLAEARFEGIMSIADDAIISVDSDRRIILFNWGAEKIFGYSSEEVLGQPLDMLLPAKLRERHAAHMAQFARSHDIARRMGERSKIVGLRKSGEVFPADASISRFSNGNEWTYTVILRDVTARVRNEAGLGVLVDVASVLVRMFEDPTTLQRAAECTVPRLWDLCVIDRRVDDASSEMAAIAGCDVLGEERIRRASVDFSRTDQDAGDSVAVDVGDLGAVEMGYALSPRLDALRECGVQAVLALPLIAHERVLGAITFGSRRTGVPFDVVTRRLAAEIASRIAVAIEARILYAKLQSAVEGRDRVLAIVSHDLRNPLSAVSMCLSGLHDFPPPDPVMSQGLVSTAEDAVEVMNRMIQDLLDTAAIDAGKLSLDRSIVPVTSLLRQAVSRMEPIVLEAGLTLTLTCDADDARVFVDTDRFAQVVSNLVGNACKFTPRGGAIRVSADLTDDTVNVVVADSGVGIPADVLPHIFDRYWHAGRTGRKHRSTGLGLSIAKGIIEAHGGVIGAHSREGHGSTFQFTIPLARDVPEAGLQSALRLRETSSV